MFRCMNNFENVEGIKQAVQKFKNRCLFKIKMRFIYRYLFFICNILRHFLFWNANGSTRFLICACYQSLLKQKIMYIVIMYLYIQWWISRSFYSSYCVSLDSNWRLSRLKKNQTLPAWLTWTIDVTVPCLINCP